MLFQTRIVFASIIFFASPLIDGQTLPAYELAALRQIARTLGKTDWNFKVDPCSGQSGWKTPMSLTPDRVKNAVTCNCSISNDNYCHVTSIILKEQNLQGTLPPELVRLPYLEEIDLPRNYLNGTLPREWGSMKLVSVSLLGNRITGSIPKEFGNISTLAKLSLEFNQLSGVIPPELGNLSRLDQIFLSSNNLTGELPSTLANCTTMKDFRISDNQFTGRIPNFIQNWTKLENLYIQASGLEGPIPLNFTLLTELSDLRISDLSGNESTFPLLSKSLNIEYIILRRCNIIGQLPADYLGTLAKLKVFDLSFNRLTGPIPSIFLGTDYIYLTENMLSGPIPSELNGTDNLDLSYNNLTINENAESRRQQRNVNLFGSSSGNSDYDIASYLGISDCSQNWYSLYINCGGGEVDTDAKIKYVEDTNLAGPSNFIRSNNWAFSSTGHFLGNTTQQDTFIWSNTLMLNVSNSELYNTARISPLSLTYYGFCLVNGNYTVRLHFAEIMFTNDQTYSSLGRRIFDIYIQGIRVHKDFNIAHAADGVGKEVVENFTAVVTDKTLEIRFLWAGKGTDAIPFKGVYGPLISAISVNSDNPPSENSISVGTVVGIVVAVAFVIFLILAVLWWKGCLRLKDTTDLDLKGLDLHTSSFTLRQIKAATNNFDAANKIGEGGFGPVYKGILSDGTTIAVKQLSSKSKQGNREFINEIGMISALQHPHLVKLYGCCIEGNQLLLVYEYLENNSLARALFGLEEFKLKLDWPTRQKICIGIARGLAYLHEESRLKVVHRDIKATNVLLDKDLNPKISDFGLAKLEEEDNTHISTRIAGTYGYMAPEYALRGYLTDKADVYSYGVVALEIVSGMANTVVRTKQNHFILIDKALELKEKGNLMELVDPKLGMEYNEEEVMVMINVALLCTSISPEDRPMMSSVVNMLEGRTLNQEFVLDPISVSTKECRQVTSMSDGELVQSMPIDGSWTAASTSGVDLYPLDYSEYMKNRYDDSQSLLMS